MPEYALLTKDNCPNCERLKKMLTGPLKGKYSQKIETVHRESAPDRFDALVERYLIRQVPALIHVETGNQLRDVSSIQEVNAFLAD